MQCVQRVLTMFYAWERIFSRPENWLHNRFTFYGDTIAETRFRALGSLRYPPKP
jgi:hypothetical protein